MNTSEHIARARDIGSTVVELSRHYAIWHEIVNPDVLPHRVSTIEQFQDLFASTALAHFCAFCTLTYQLYDKRRDVTSICRFLDVLRGMNLTIVSELESEIDINWPIITRIFDIRSNVYAHRAKLITEEEVFSRAKLTPFLMGSIVNLAQENAARILESTGADSYVEYINEVNNREFSAREDVQRLFDRLANHT